MRERERVPGPGECVYVMPLGVGLSEALQACHARLMSSSPTLKSPNPDLFSTRTSVATAVVWVGVVALQRKNPDTHLQPGVSRRGGGMVVAGMVVVVVESHLSRYGSMPVPLQRQLHETGCGAKAHESHSPP